MPIITQSSQNNEVNWDDPLNKGLVAWYPLQLGGNVRRDVVGNNHGTLNGNVTQGVYSHAPGGRLIFDDTSASDFVSGDGNFFKGNAISFFAEVTKDQINRDVIFSNGSAVGVNDGWSYQVRDDGSLWFTLQGVNSYITSAAIFGSGGGNRLRQLGFCWDAVASKVYMYSEGRLIDTLNTGSMLGTPSIFRIGDHLQFPGNPVRVKVGDIRIYDRVLTESEVHDLHQASRTGYKDQFKRRYFPVSTTVEEPPAEETTGGLIRLKSPKPTQPSYAAGYAKSASESAYPELWDGLKVAYSPQLGHRGSVSQLDIVEGRVLTRNRIGTSVEDVASERGIVSEITDAKSLSAPIDWDALGFTDGGFSYFMEINPSVAGNGNVPLSGEYVSSGNEGFFQSFYSSGFVFRIHGENDTSWIGRKSTVGQSTGWKNIACTWGGSGTSSDIAIYFDAVRSDTLDEQSGTFDTAQSTAGGLSIGAQGTAGLLNGACDGQYGTILLYNRALSPSEIQQLHADPLAPFRQRKSVPYTLTSAPPVEEETTGGLIRLKSPKQTQPSYKAGYAKSASESAYPELWEGLHTAHIPLLGPTGTRVVDLGPHGLDLTDSATTISPDDWSIGEYGYQMISTGGTMRLSTGEIPYNRGEATVFFAGELLDNDGSSLSIVGQAMGTQPFDFRLTHNTAFGNHRIGFGWGYSIAYVESASQVTRGEAITLCGVRKGSTGNWDADLWIDGEIDNSETGVTSNPGGSSSPAKFRVSDSGATSGKVQGFSIALSWTRALSDEEVRLLNADPLAPFRQRRTAIYSTQATTPPSNEFTLTAETGSFAIAGNDAGLTYAKSYSITAETGSFALAGNDVDLDANRKLTADAGSFVLTGNSATLTKTTDNTLNAGTGPFTLDGNDSGLKASRKAVADTGSFALNGIDSALKAVRKVSVNTGEFNLGGNNAELTYTPTSPSLVAGTGEFALSGNDASLVITRRVAVNAGEFTLNGFEVGFKLSRSFTAATGAFDLGGEASNLIVSRSVVAGTGEFLVVGSDVRIRYSEEGTTSLIQIKSAFIQSASAAGSITGADSNGSIVTP